MYKVKELVQFEKIKKVVDIDHLFLPDVDQKYFIENYVISQALEEYLISLLKLINAPSHRSAHVIGGYGSGKSHLLAFVTLLLSNKELKQFIKNENVQTIADNIKRDFCIVQFELQPGRKDLCEYFYYQIGKQLRDKYRIETEINFQNIFDHKTEISRVVDRIKQGNPTRGLMVIVDEISDFLKQKNREDIQRDMQFLRILGQQSEAIDFMFIGAMQEHVFTNPKYIDEAESFGRIQERFEIITISREDIKQVISKRILNKTENQKIELEKLLQALLPSFSLLQTKLEEFIQIYPLHPYVIELFDGLPYFEKRGVLTFTMDEVEKILNETSPIFITYDKIYDEIESTHTLKNLEEVRPIIDAVNTLKTKTDFIEEKYRDAALKIVKALAVLNLYSKTEHNGASSEELANTLLIAPPGKTLSPDIAKDYVIDFIKLVISKLRGVTYGQFINVTESGYYFLDLEKKIDIDEVIKRRAENLPENAEDNEFQKILEEQFFLERQDQFLPIYQDTCSWENKKTYCIGTVVYEKPKSKAINEFKIQDYLLILTSPFSSASQYKAAENTAILKFNLSSPIREKLKLLAAAHLLRNENYQRSITEKRYLDLRKELTKPLYDEILEKSTIATLTESRTLKSYLDRDPGNLNELFFRLKPAIFQDVFEKLYSDHPIYFQKLSAQNIVNSMTTAMTDLLRRGPYDLFSNTQNFLSALKLMDQKGNIDSNNSPYAQDILSKLKDAGGKVVDVEEVYRSLSAKPIGMEKQVIQFLLLVLNYNGELSFQLKGGKSISGDDLLKYFENDLSRFDEIKYLIIEQEFPIAKITKLFRYLEINPQNLAHKQTRIKALQEFRTEILKLEETQQQCQRLLQQISTEIDPFLPVADLQKLYQETNQIPFEKFKLVKSLPDFGRLELSENEFEIIKENVATLKKLQALLTSYHQDLHELLNYAQTAMKIVQASPNIFKASDIETLNSFYEEATTTLKNASQALDIEQRRPVLGKLQEFKKRYKQLYYFAHENHVGNKVPWDILSEVRHNQIYQNLILLKSVKCVNSNRFHKISEQILKLEQAKCAKFQAEYLEQHVLCPFCHFPQEFPIQTNLKKDIDHLQNEISDIWSEWQDLIFSEIQNYKTNLSLLPAYQQQLIQDLETKKKIPEKITEHLVTALNDLFKDLEAIQLNATEFIDYIFAGSSVVDANELKQKLEEYIHKLIGSKSADNIRFKKGE